MNGGRIEKTKMNVIWGMITKIITLLIPFVTRTIIIYTLGIEYTGLGSLFTSILSVLSLAELGIGSAMVFSMYKPLAEGDNSKVCALLNVYKKAYRIIGSIILILGIFVTPFLKYLINDDVPDGINIYIVFMVYLLSTCIGYFFGAYRNSIFTGNQRIDITQKIHLVVNLAQSLGQIVCLLVFKNYYSYVIWLPVSTIMNNSLIVFLSKKYFPQFDAIGNIDKTELKAIEKKVGGLIASKIGGVVLSSVDTIVISSFLGLTVLGIYNGYYYVISTLFGFLAVIYSSLIPSVGNYMQTQTKEDVYRLFKIFRCVYAMIVSWATCCLVVLYQPFITLWQGQDNVLEFGIVACLSAYFFFHKIGDVSGIFKESAGVWWEGKFVPLIAAALNLTINLITVQFIGLYGIVISTIIALVVVYIPWGSFVLFKYYFKDLKKWYGYLISCLYYFLITVISAGITYFIGALISSTGWLELIIKSLLCIIIPIAALILLALPLEEFRLSVSYMKKNILRKLFKR